MVTTTISMKNKMKCQASNIHRAHEHSSTCSVCIRTRNTNTKRHGKRAKSQTIYNIQNIYWFMFFSRLFFIVPESGDAVQTVVGEFLRAISILSSIESTWVNLHSTVVSANCRSLVDEPFSDSVFCSLCVVVCFCTYVQTHTYTHTESFVQRESVCRYIVLFSLSLFQSACFFYFSLFSRHRSVALCFVLNVILSCPAWHISDYFCLSKWIFMNGVVLPNTKHKKYFFLFFTFFCHFQYDICCCTIWIHSISITSAHQAPNRYDETDGKK